VFEHRGFLQVSKTPVEPAKNSMANPDVYRDVTTGYLRIAEHMALMPESVMFWTFHTLKIRNNLYMQVEVVFVEMKPRKVEA
jgi:hypothetical protein